MKIIQIKITFMTSVEIRISNITKTYQNKSEDIQSVNNMRMMIKNYLKCEIILNIYLYLSLEFVRVVKDIDERDRQTDRGTCNIMHLDCSKAQALISSPTITTL